MNSAGRKSVNMPVDKNLITIQFGHRAKAKLERIK